MCFLDKHNHWTDEKMQVMPRVSFVDFVEFVPRFYSTLNINMFVYGNIRENVSFLASLIPLFGIFNANCATFTLQDAPMYFDYICSNLKPTKRSIIYSVSFVFGLVKQIICLKFLYLPSCFSYLAH